VTDREGRIESARRRSLTAKRTLAGVSAAAFVAALLFARASHPGQAATSQSSGASTGSSGATQSQSDDSFGFDSGSIAPSAGSSPDVQTNVS
jgi:hypothetical protein